jgi:hypothetical protein
MSLLALVCSKQVRSSFELSNENTVGARVLTDKNNVCGVNIIRCRQHHCHSHSNCTKLMSNVEGVNDT